MNTQIRRRLRQAIAATAVAAVAVIGLAAPASANPIIPDPLPAGTIPSITVHKLLNPTGTLTNANGLESSSATGTPLGGIEFQIQSIANVDLRTTAGWTTAGAYAADPATIPAGDLGAAVTGTTATSDPGKGTYTFDNGGTGLAIGAYLVKENLTPAQVAAGITPSEPFVVTVPITHPTDLNTWVYDVHVYPKNLQTTPVKTVDDGPGTTYQVGDKIDWTISAPVPAQTTDLYAFKDVLVSHLEIPADAGSPTTFADSIVVSVGGTALAATDYTITYDPATDNTLVVELTPSGLTALNAVVGTAQQIALTLTTEVQSLPADGILENTGIVFPNSGFPLTGPGVVTPPVESKFGEINILKQDSDTNAPLAGAEFKVFKSEADAKAFAADPTATANAALPLQAQENGTGALVETFTTDAAGEVSITGLRASNWEDGAELPDTDKTKWQGYWVLETKAPAGYALATAPFGPVYVLYNAAAPTVLPFANLTVPNATQVQLPLTGGTIATWLFTLTGVLILSGVALMLIGARRRNKRA